MQTLQLLAEPTLLFRAIAESIPQIVWSTTPDGYHDYFNERWYEYTGMSREAGQGWNWKDFLHADDYERTVERWAHCLRTGEPYEIEYRFRRAADGAYRWFLARAEPLRDGEQRIRRWFGTCTDIDDAKQREAALAFLAEAGTVLGSSLDVERTLRSVARLAVPRLADWCAVDVRDDDGRVRRLAVEHVDPARVRLAHELAERYPEDTDAPHGLAQVLRTGEAELVPEIPAALLEGAARDDEHRRIIRELQLRSYMIVPLVVQGRVWGAISLVSAEGGRRFGPEELRTARELAGRAALAIESAQRYQERVHAQERLEQQAAELEMQNEQLQEQGVELEMQAAQMQEQAVELAAANDALLAGNAALRESESRLTLALEGGRLGWWEWEIPQNRILWSAQLERIYGLPVGAFDGRFETYAGLIHPEDRPVLQARIERLFAERAEGYEIRHRIVRVDGATRWIEAHAKLVLDAHGAPLRLLGVAADVTDAITAERERAELLAREQAARHEAESANRAKAEFLATMSHELRTPLNAIAGYTDLLSMGVRGVVTPEQHEDLRRIRRSAQHLLSLINDILNFARLEAGQVELHLGRVPMHEALAGVEALVVPQLREKALRFTYEECDPALAAHGDAEKVQQILLNLLTNAVKFTDAGGSIHLSCGASGGAGPATVWVEVRDTGRGIPADKLETIFEPFVQIDRHLTHESQQGVGLGLAISRDLARAMNGDLTVRSAVGKGTTFRLTLRQ